MLIRHFLSRTLRPRRARLRAAPLRRNRGGAPRSRGCTGRTAAAVGEPAGGAVPAALPARLRMYEGALALFSMHLLRL